MKINKDLTTWTPGERLWLWRRARGLTGRQAAARLGLGRNAFWAMEGGQRPPVPKANGVAPNLPLLLQLARRRAGAGLRGTAARLGVTHPTLLAMERAGAPRLQEWWEKRGFVFPQD